MMKGIKAEEITIAIVLSGFKYKIFRTVTYMLEVLTRYLNIVESSKGHINVCILRMVTCSKGVPLLHVFYLTRLSKVL